MTNVAPSFCAAFPELTSPSLCSSSTFPFHFSFRAEFQFIFRMNQVSFACSYSLTGSVLIDPLSWKSSSLCNPPPKCSLSTLLPQCFVIPCDKFSGCDGASSWENPKASKSKHILFFLFSFFSLSTGKASRSCCISLSSPKRVGSMHLRSPDPSESWTHSKSSVCMANHQEPGAAPRPCEHFNCEVFNSNRKRGTKGTSSIRTASPGAGFPHSPQRFAALAYAGPEKKAIFGKHEVANTCFFHLSLDRNNPVHLSTFPDWAELNSVALELPKAGIAHTRTCWGSRAEIVNTDCS